MGMKLSLILSVILFGLLTTLYLTPFVKRIAQKSGVISYPGGRRNHEKPTPLWGGLGIYIPFAVVFLVFYAGLLAGKFPDSRPQNLQMLSIFLGSSCIFLFGVVDDKHHLGWKTKFIGQLFAVIILVLGGHSVTGASIPYFGPVEFGWLGIPIFCLAILTITNAINLIDGLDGLAGGICFFAATTCGIIAIWNGDLFSAVVGFVISGSLLGFLWFNFPPATIFLGDGGSLSLGFILGTLAASSAAASYPGQRSGTLGMLIIPFLPFSIALLDVILAVLRRWITGRKVFLPDSDHLHHRLMEKFHNPRRVIAIFYLFSALLSAMTIYLVLIPQSDFHKVLGAVWVLFLMGAVVAVLKLYRVENLGKVLANRPHFQFVTSYHSFMSLKIFRTNSFETLISLLESGVKDLEFDSVEVISEGVTISYWSSPTRIHPKAPRISGQLMVEDYGLIIKWVVPTHHSESYQNFLATNWYAIVEEIAIKAGKLRAESEHLPLAGHLKIMGAVSRVDSH